MTLPNDPDRYWVNKDNGVIISDFRKQHGHSNSRYEKFSIACKSYEEANQKANEIKLRKETNDSVDS